MFATHVRYACCLWLVFAPVSDAQLTQEQIDEINRRNAEAQAIERRNTIARLTAELEKSTDKDLSANSAIDFLHHSLKLSADEGIPIYRRFLTHPHPWVRQSCLRALGDHGAKARAAGTAIFDIHRNDSHNYNRDEAVQTLGKIGFEIDELWEFLNARLEHTDVNVRHYHAEFIAMAALHYGPQAKPLLPSLRQVLSETTLPVPVRRKVFRAIGAIVASPAPRATEIEAMTLIDWKQPDGGYALLQELAKPDYAKQATTIALRTLRKPLANYARCELYQLLGQVGGTSPDAVTELVAGLEQNDPHVRQSASNALLQIPPTSHTVMEQLARMLKDTESEEVARHVVPLLMKWGQRAKPATEGVLRRLRAMDDHTKPETIIPYLQLLRRIGPDAQQASRHLVLMLKRETFAKTGKFHEPRLRGLLVATLTDLQAASDVEDELVAMLRPGNDQQYDLVNYMWAARALASFKPTNKEAIPLLMVALGKDRRLNQPIDTITGQDHFFVPFASCSSPRMEAIKALGRFGPLANDAIPLLETIANEKKTPLPSALRDRWPNDAAAEARLALQRIRDGKAKE